MMNFYKKLKRAWRRFYRDYRRDIEAVKFLLGCLFGACGIFSFFALGIILGGGN